MEAEQTLQRGERLFAIIENHEHHDLRGPAAREAQNRLNNLQRSTAYRGSVITDPRRLVRIMRREDPHIYLGHFVTCVYNPEKALCRRQLTGDDGKSMPDLSSCEPLRCRNVALTAANREALTDQLHKLDENGQRTCAWCDMQRRAKPCTACGRIKHVANRDAAGRPFCQRCWRTNHDGPADPVGVVCDAVCALQPGLDRATITEVIRSVAASPAMQRKLAIAIQANPSVFTGLAHTGPPQLPTLIDKLIVAGADNVVAPKCPFCQKNRPLAYERDGQRCCKRCYYEVRKRPCGRCGRATVGRGRDAEDRVLCLSCRKSEPALF